MGNCAAVQSCTGTRHNTNPNNNSNNNNNSSDIDSINSATNSPTSNDNNLKRTKHRDDTELSNNNIRLQPRLSTSSSTSPTTTTIPQTQTPLTNYINHISLSTSFNHFMPPTGKNKKLKKDLNNKYFKCNKKISMVQLQTKRDEFWDTEPAFGGKSEIWSALHAALDAYQLKNYQLAQAIIDSANIILPNGMINDCYDEWGYRYQLPIYVYAKPSCMADKNSNSSKLWTEYDEDEELVPPDSADTTINNFLNLNLAAAAAGNRRRFKNKNKKIKKGDHNKSSHSEEEEEEDEEEEKGKVDEKESKSDGEQISSKNNSKNEITTVVEDESSFQIKLRISKLCNDEDAKIRTNGEQTFSQIKQLISDRFNIEVSQQRLFFGGKRLKDNDKVKNHRIRRNIVIQVIVRENTKVEQDEIIPATQP
jgi:hypothetical protein